MMMMMIDSRAGKGKRGTEMHQWKSSGVAKWAVWDALALESYERHRNQTNSNEQL